MTQAAPIAIFVYQRAEHTRRMLRSLLGNALAMQSPISIYCDGPRGEQDADAVARARAVVRDLAPAHARVVERDGNLGLARSVIAGVSDAIAAHGAAIVIEDDLELSPVALDYFNAALARYRDEERVMHLSGYMYPVGAVLPEAFFYREATCYGWATWSRAWQHFEADGRRILQALRDRGARHDFDVSGSIDFSGMLEAQIAGRVDSWAIRWYGSIWMRGGLALHPGRSLIRNTGFDGSGEHGGASAAYDVELCTQPVRAFPGTIEEDGSALKAMIAYRRGAVWRNKRDALRRAWRRWLS